MALASQTRRPSEDQKCLLRRNSQNSICSPVVERVDFCRNKPRLVELEKQLYSLANGRENSEEVMRTCQTLLGDAGNINETFNVFCSCCKVDRYKEPTIAQLFYDLVNVQNGSSLLTELEMACEELLKVLTHLGTPNTLQFNVVSLLHNLSRLTDIPSSHLEAVQSYLEEIARALWPYSKPLAPNLWVSEAFCDAQCDVLKACGKFLEEKCPVNTERTFQMISNKLISGEISKYSRFRLLEIQELQSSGWKVSEATKNYYKGAYLKFFDQHQKDLSCRDTHVQTEAISSQNESRMVDAKAEGADLRRIKPVAVLRINESELRKSFGNIQQELSLAQDAILKEKDKEAYLKLYPFGDGEKLATCKQPVSLNKLAPHVSLTNNILQEASSSFNSSDGSDDVFATNDKVGFEKKIREVHPALHWEEFREPRHSFKSDSSLTSDSECLVTRMASLSLSDTEENMINDDVTTIGKVSSNLINSSEVKELSSGLVINTCPLKSIASSHEEQHLHIVPSEKKIGDPKNKTTERDGENWEEKTVLSSEKSLENANDNSPVTENWRERKPAKTDKSQDDGNGHYTVADTWKERTLVNLKEAQNNNTINAYCENWRERKPSNIGKSDEDIHGHHVVTENWREEPLVDLEDPGRNWRESKMPILNKSLEDVSDRHSVVGNWRESPLVTFREPQNSFINNLSGINYREQKPEKFINFWSGGSDQKNWRDRKSMSLDESKQDPTSTASQQTRRHSLSDLQLERQNSHEKGNKRGFGLPKPDEQVDIAERTEHFKEETVEVQMTQEETEGLKGWQLREIQADTDCKIHTNREKCVLTITGHPQQCKVAKKKVYSVIAALQEQFGALVPLSDVVLQHLQSDGCSILADRLAFFSLASVTMINDTQLFISGRRNCVNHAKAQLAKIKVMLRYTDDPDVARPSQKDSSEEKHQLVEELFAALERGENATGQSYHTEQAGVGAEQAPTREGLSREFILSCALSPVARQRPVNISLDRTEDWVREIVLGDGRRGERDSLHKQIQRKGFGSPMNTNNLQDGTETSTS